MRIYYSTDQTGKKRGSVEGNIVGRPFPCHFFSLWRGLSLHIHVVKKPLESFSGLPPAHIQVHITQIGLKLLEKHQSQRSLLLPGQISKADRLPIF